MSEAVAADPDVTALADRAYEVVRAGGLVLIPADIGYGFLGNSGDSMRRMYELKGRPLANPCIVAANLATLRRVARPGDPALLDWVAEIAADQTIAVVVPIDTEAPEIRALDPWARTQAVTDGTVALFLNTGVYVERMIARAEEDRILLIGSSGNRSGTGNNYRFTDVPAEIRAGVDFTCDLGTMRHANDQRLATTIVNLTRFTVRRVGVGYDAIRASYEAFAARRPDLPLRLAVESRTTVRRVPAGGGQR